jgi:hypothetical protein
MDSTDTALFNRYTAVLKYSTGFTAVVGMGFVVLSKLTASVFDWMVFESRGLPLPSGLIEPDTRRYCSFVIGVLGAVMTGWGVQMNLHLSSTGWQGRQQQAWRAIAWPVFSWFAVDTTWSYLTGYWPNCVLNIGFFGVLGVPLLMARHLFRP